MKGLNLSFECWCYHPQIRELVDLAHTFPDTTIILNHFGIPLGVGIYRGRSEEVFYHWRSNIEKLAKCDNVKIKLGGLNMPENGFDWHTKSLPPSSRQLIKATRRYFETAIEFFGVKRCMFESNFPVDKISCSYNVLWNAFKSLTKDYSKDERASLFHDTAVTTYRL